MQQAGAGGADLRARGKQDDGEELVFAFATWDCGSPLYDSFELASLHHVLESHLMALPFPGAAASRSRRLEHRGGAALPDATDRGAGSRRRRRRRRGWRGGKAAAAIFRAVTWWKRL